ncbi:MAG: hypothetical protein RIR70_280 [Pseudomonadota bacterium]|jgi:type IV secretion system protein VirB1
MQPARASEVVDFFALAQQCAPWVAPQTMAAIVKTESGFRPLAIGVNGGAKLIRQPVSREEAVVTAKWLLANGYNIDLGLGQVNSTNLKKVGLTLEDAFDPCRNLAAAATILQQNYQTARNKLPEEQTALRAALSAYNTGSFSRGFSNGYVQKVVTNACTTENCTGTASAAPIPLVGTPARTPSASVPVRLRAEESRNNPVRHPISVYESAHTADVMVFR